MHRQLATHGTDTVASTLLGLGGFYPIAHSSYQASVSNGSVVIFGETAHFDAIDKTILEPRANIREACEYLSTFQATGGIEYAVICTDGRKVLIRLRSAQEERELRRALAQFDRRVNACSTEP
jgi:hypothetical protein